MVLVPLPVDLAAVAVGAMQGALFAGQLSNRRVDLIGMLFVGISAGLGGGLIRDLLLNRVPAALSSNNYLTTAVAAALVGMLFSRLVRRLLPLLVIFDAGTLALYMVVGIATAAGAGLGTVPAIFVGVLASTGGGLIRDVLTGSPIALVQPGTFYVTAALGGAVGYALLLPYLGSGTAAVAAGSLTFALRMLSLWFGWTSPAPRSLDIDLPLGRPGQ